MKTFSYDELDRYGYNKKIMELVAKGFVPNYPEGDTDPLLEEAVITLVSEIDTCVNQFGDQRFGQILHNYGEHAVQDVEKGDVALNMFRAWIFGLGVTEDKFFEESRTTYENLYKRVSEVDIEQTGYEYKHVQFNHPKNEEGVFWDLVGKYQKFGTLYIGVDFDNTLLPYTYNDHFDEEGNLVVSQGYLDVVSLLRWCKLLGMKLCLWSLPSDQDNLDWKVEWCDMHGIHMDFINESPLLTGLTNQFGKPHFNLLLDDVAGLESAYSVLYNLCEYIDDGHGKIW